MVSGTLSRTSSVFPGRPRFLIVISNPDCAAAPAIIPATLQVLARLGAGSIAKVRSPYCIFRLTSFPFHVLVVSAFSTASGFLSITVK